MANKASSVSSGCTQLNVSKIIYKWTISNFLLRPEEMGEALYSPSFSSGLEDDTEWCLRIYPNGDQEASVDYVGLYLVLKTSKYAKVSTHFKLSVLNGKDEKIQARISSIGRRFKPSELWGWSDFIKRSELLEKSSELLPEGKLTFLCEIDVATYSVNTTDPSCNIFKAPQQQLIDDFNNLLQSQELSDVTLVAGDGEIKAHKVILAARSDVFAAMFTHIMDENKSNRVEIMDIDHNVLQAMVHYIYTGKISNLNEMAAGLLAASDKYALNNLKKMCEATMSDKLSVENAADTLVLADLHSADQLKAKTLEFIVDHATDLMENVTWNNMKTSHPDLIYEAFCAVAKKFNGKALM